jgi:hypothetical protein
VDGRDSACGRPGHDDVGLWHAMTRLVFLAERSQPDSRGLGLRIHDFMQKIVDGRNKSGHDDS